MAKSAPASGPNIIFKLGLVILVLALVYGLTLQLQNFSKTEVSSIPKQVETVNTPKSATSSPTQEKTIPNEQQTKQASPEEDDDEYEEYVVPSLSQTKEVNQKLFDESVQIIKDTYKVSNTTEVNNIMNELGMFFNKAEDETINAYTKGFTNNAKKNRDLLQPFLGIYRDDFYCLKSDIYHFTHEKEFYNNITLFSDWGDEYTREDLFGNFSTVASEMYGWELPRELIENESFALELNISQYYLNRPKFMSAFPQGKQFGCLFQGINKIPSSGAFTRKEGLARSYRKFLQAVDEVNSNPNITKKFNEKCMKEFDFLPKTFNLNTAQECKSFFDYVQTEEYAQAFEKDGFQYISKLGANVHQGKGINVVTPQIMNALIKKYDSGKLCGSIGEQNPELIQGYLNDPLLLNGVKFEIRMHFVVASVNPLIIYAQDKAGVAFCALKYKAHDEQIQRHLCVYNIGKKLLDLSDEELFKISGKTREQYQSSFSYQHTLETLQVALENEGSVPPGWVQNDFTPSVFRNFIHTLLFTRHQLVDDSRYYEMYAPDILINKRTMKPYILEYNTNPRMVNTSHFVHDWNLATIKDIVLINMAQVRSRYFRIRSIVDEYLHELVDKKNPDTKEYLKRLVEANKNKVEPQFNIEDKLTSYVKIYDETDPKDLYYKGNLIFDKECTH